MNKVGLAGGSRVADSKPELSDPRPELFLREYYHMGDSRICTLTWANIFDACKNYVATRNNEKVGQDKNDNDHEIDSETKEQAWRDEAPEYVSNSDAVKMAGDKISMPTLSKNLIFSFTASFQKNNAKVYIII